MTEAPSSVYRRRDLTPTRTFFVKSGPGQDCLESRHLQRHTPWRLLSLCRPPRPPEALPARPSPARPAAPCLRRPPAAPQHEDGGRPAAGAALRASGHGGGGQAGAAASRLFGPGPTAAAQPPRAPRGEAARPFPRPARPGPFSLGRRPSPRRP